MINRKTILAIINLGATSNFIYTKTKDWDRILTQKKQRLYKLGLVDRSYTSLKEG